MSSSEVVTAALSAALQPTGCLMAFSWRLASIRVLEVDLWVPAEEERTTGFARNDNGKAGGPDAEFAEL